MAQYLFYVLQETHVEHLVGLVENHGMHVVQLHLAALYEVYEAARGGDYHLHAPAQGAYL